MHQDFDLTLILPRNELSELIKINMLHSYHTSEKRSKPMSGQLYLLHCHACMNLLINCCDNIVIIFQHLIAGFDLLMTGWSTRIRELVGNISLINWKVQNILHRAAMVALAIVYAGEERTEFGHVYLANFTTCLHILKGL